MSQKDIGYIKTATRGFFLVYTFFFLRCICCSCCWQTVFFCLHRCMPYGNLVCAEFSNQKRTSLNFGIDESEKCIQRREREREIAIKWLKSSHFNSCFSFGFSAEIFAKSELLQEQEKRNQDNDDIQGKRSAALTQRLLQVFFVENCRLVQRIVIDRSTIVQTFN